MLKYLCMTLTLMPLTSQAAQVAAGFEAPARRALEAGRKLWALQKTVEAELATCNGVPNAALIYLKMYAVWQQNNDNVPKLMYDYQLETQMLSLRQQVDIAPGNLSPALSAFYQSLNTNINYEKILKDLYDFSYIFETLHKDPLQNAASANDEEIYDSCCGIML